MISALRAEFLRKNLDGIFVLDEHERGFFSGFWSSSGFFFVLRDSVHFFTDARYLAAARDFFQNSEVQVSDFLKKDEWQDFFVKNGVSKLGTDFSKISTAQFRRFKKAFGISFSSFSAEKIRAQKSELHISAAEKAAHIADKALKKSLLFLKIGISEKEFAWILEKIGREELGAERVSFPATVAFGAHSAVPHHAPTDAKLTAEMPILIDWGFEKNRLCSDCTRNFWFGKNPSHKWTEIFQKVLAAQTAGIAKMRIGKRISEVQNIAEKVLGQKIPHSFGHGVGVEAHEFPTISPKQKGIFAENMLVTAEPGLYCDGEFGIRIEDLLVIEKNGARSLTHFPKGISGSILPAS